jgi:hypothetical protein
VEASMKIGAWFAIGVLFFVHAPLAVSGESKDAPESKAGAPLLPIFKRLETESLAKTRWELAFAYHKEAEAKLLSNEDGARRLEKGIPEPKRGDFNAQQSYDWAVAEAKLLRKHLPSLVLLFREDFRLIGRDLPHFAGVYSGLPVGFANYKDSVALLTTSAMSGTTFNTKRANAKQRARETAILLLPAIKQMRERFSDPGIQYFGMSIVYGCNDFADKSTPAQAEFLMVLLSRESVAKFASGEATDDETIASAAVFVCDSDTNDLKRISFDAK